MDCVRSSVAWGVVALRLVIGSSANAQDYERSPINYGATRPENPVSRLQARLKEGSVRLRHEGNLSYLRSVLRALDVPESSQVLVFSKTSLQRERISPETPRAIYFNDETYVGYCLFGDVIEISTADPKLGGVFYTLDQEESEAPRLARQTDACLLCHGSSHTEGVPGHLARSVFTDDRGFPILSTSTYRVDHSSPLEHRWGGWYVSGSHGKQVHMGNQTIRKGFDPERVSNTAGMNLSDLSQKFDVSNYLSPHSDITALMVLEHQAQGHNLIARASFLTRIALEHEAALNRDLGRPAGERWESTTRRLDDACEPLVRYLLMGGEVALTDPIRGVSGFAKEFSSRGPFDDEGRSLRELDLSRRLFRYPFSYLVYSPAFLSLPDEAETLVWRRVREILDGEDRTDAFKHLSETDRRLVKSILAQTHPRANVFLKRVGASRSPGS